ncbi:MAG: asparagine synthase (glutamine-hydrolyzing) [Acidobacteria bacterium]|nr:asparagine synthase (glutamine-hydrolyzing) [Acidobacteriota bacterium]
MCGIAGIYEYQRQRSVQADILQHMTDVIEHRGPDDAGAFINGSIALGMRRLSIIDIAGGRQPVSNETGEIKLIFNGEIYNFRSLQADLIDRGHLLQTSSDTEVITHLYEEQGTGCVNSLRGMFGFALWDAGRNRLMLARDRLGIKPLYYTSVDGVLIFGSEIKSILQHPSVVAELDIDALNNFLSMKYVPSPQTMFRGIHSLPPGFILTCDRSGIALSRYWDLSFSSQVQLSEGECAEHLDTLLRESILLHLQSDVPFGAFLSGGLDSSVVVGLMANYVSHPVNTFSVGFERQGAEISETHYARIVADHFGTRHHEVIITSADFLSHAQSVAWHLDQPIADLACFANMMLAECASQNVKMVLTGEGGDELFGGYARYAGERFRSLTKFIPDWIGGSVVRASSLLPGLRRPKLALNALMESDEASRLLHWFPLFGTQEKLRLLSNDTLQRISSLASAEKIVGQQLVDADTSVALHRMLYVDTKLWLPDDLLARGDKMSMAASLEARVPLLDHKLVEFAAALPPHLKIHNLTRKYLLKKVAADFLPSTIIQRKKMGFPIPISAWFRGDVKEFVSDLLSRDTVARRGLFNPDYVQTILKEHLRGTADRGAQLWGLVLVELWHRRFLDSASQDSSARNESLAVSH